MDDNYFMSKAIANGRAVAGKTGENPPVGCVIVKDGRIIAHGATQPPGSAHAEVMAVAAAEAAGHDLSRAVFYITLEPCSFQGRTPPCTRLLVVKRPSRVVIGIRDPHPLVRGAGIRELRAAGIEVAEGVLQAAVSAALDGWVRRFPERR